MAKENILDNWVTLNNRIMSMSEKDLTKLLKVEEQGQNRISFLLRIQGRINKLRARREREAVMKAGRK